MQLKTHWTYKYPKNLFTKKKKKKETENYPKYFYVLFNNVSTA